MNNNSESGTSATDKKQEKEASWVVKLDEDGETESIPEPATTNTREIIFGSKERTLIICLAALAVIPSGLPVQIFYPSLIAIEQEFNTTATVVNIAVTAYKAVQAIVPLVWGSLSDLWGRRVTYMSAMAISLVGCAGIALAPNIETLIGIRMLQGFGGSPLQSFGSGVISDVTVPATRGVYMSYYSTGYKICSVTGPVLGGIIAQHLSWRWSFWILVIATGTILIIVTIFLPETLPYLAGGYYNPTPIQWFKQQRQKCKHGEIGDLPNQHNEMAKTRFKRIPDFREPYRFLLMPDFLLVMLIEGLYFGVQGCYMINTPYLYRDHYNLNVEQIGLTYLAQTSGSVIAGLTSGHYLSYCFRKIARKYDGEDHEKKATGYSNKLPLDFPIYRARLKSVWHNAILAQLVTIAYGWCFVYNTHLAVPMILQFILAFNVQFMNSATRCLLIDLRPGKGASVSSSVGLLRQTFAGTGSVVMYPLTKAIGPGWTYTLLSAILMITNIFIAALQKYGVQWRTKRALREEIKN
ncbi:major facilitator superfamily domain-containing protein [Fennellomyces sp. T-0311]|nr:major facilitator superfamily domain-containing protein [Fennellomyces sp. T-0311]